MKSFSLLFIFMCSASFAKTQKKICLSDHIFKEFKSYGKSLENAVNLAKKEMGSDTIIEKHYFDKSPLAAIAAYKNMEKAGCDAIIGFSYLSDLLTISNAIPKIKIPIISPFGATFSKKLQKNINLIQPSQYMIVHTMIDFIKTRYAKKKIIVITDIKRAEMQEYKKALEAYSKAMNITFTDLLGDKTEFEKVQESEIVITLAGAASAAKLVKKLKNKKVIFGVETFGSKTSPSLMRLLKKSSEHDIYAIRNLSYSINDAKINKFFHQYEKEYQSKPSILSLYGYDSTKLLINMLKNKSDFKGISGFELKNKTINSSDRYVLVKPSNDYELIKTGRFK